MSTSLAEQLQRLRVPQTTLLKQDKKRPSLLFDPKEAANLNRDTFFQIGLEGLEELIKKNVVFVQFENTLFHITSKEFERSVQSAEANQKLNRNIKQFLLLLSPYFLLNCAHKALEWLVNRYYIHEYNKEDFLMLILPYHETNIFVRALQLMQFNNKTDKWIWLKSLQKSGIHLEKNTLLKHAANDVYIIQFISDFILSIVEEYDNPTFLTVVFNFYCTTFTGALEYSPKISEAQLSQILPSLLEGLDSNIPDFCAASYVIAAKLLLKAEVSNKLLDTFIKKITKFNVPSLKSEALLLLIVLYQSQKQYKVMPEQAVLNLTNKDWTPRVIEELNKSGAYIFPFLTPFSNECFKIGLITSNETCQAFIIRMLNNIKLEESFISGFLNKMLDLINSNKKYTKQEQQWMSDIISNIERGNPALFDEEVKKIMKISEEQQYYEKRKKLQKILNYSMSLKGNYDIFEKLYHPHPEFRKQAIKYIAKNYNWLKDREKNLIKSVFIDRLNDENVDVVVGTLKTSTKILMEVIGNDTLKNILIKLLDKCYCNETNWWKITQPVLSILCFAYNEWDFEVFLAIFPFILPINNNEFNTAKLVINSPFAKKCNIINQLQPHLTNCFTYETFFKAVFVNIAYTDGLKNFVDNLKKIPKENLNAFKKFLISWLLSATLSENSSTEVSALIIEIYIIFLEKTELTDEADDFVLSHIINARKGKLCLQAFMQCLNRVITKTAKPNQSVGLMNINQNDFFSLIADILLKKCYKKKYSVLCMKSLDKFLVHFSNDLKTNIEFALNISVSNNLDYKGKLNCLNYITMLLKIEKGDGSLDDVNQNINVNNFTDFNVIIIPYLLVLLCNPNENIRNKIFIIIEYFIAKINKKTGYLLFLQGIIEHKKEIMIDNEQTPLVTYNVLSDISKQNEKFSKNILDNLVNVATNITYPTYLNAGISIVLSHINTIEIFNKSSKLALELLNNNKSLDANKSCIIYKNILRFDMSIAANINIDSNIWKFISFILKNDTFMLHFDETVSNPTVLILNQINRELFDNLNSTTQMSLIDLIIYLTTTTQNPEILACANQIFKHIDLDTVLIVNHLKEMRDVKSPRQNVSKIKRRVSVIPTADILDTLQWRKGITVLQYIQDKKKIKNTELLLPLLFDVLKKCLDFDEQGIVEYPKQLLLSSILHCCNKIDEKLIPENVFNMELIVQCIRASQNPQTHHHALLLLAHTSTFIPTQVLHNIMAIFTFMGSSVLRHDDAYSFQIIAKIIDTVIPILIKDNSINKIATVLRVFVDAILDVPEHRRTPVYKQLLTKINPKENLHLFLLLVFESFVMHNINEKQKPNNSRLLADVEGIPKRLDIAANLCREFSTEIVINACIKLMKYVRALPVEKEDQMEIDGECITFDIANHTPKQFRHYKYILILFISNLLSSKEFVNQVACLNDEQMLQLEPFFKDMIVSVLTYIQNTSKIAEKNSKTPQAQYWKVMLHHIYDILDSLNSLLTPQMFLLVIKGLMNHSFNTVRRRAIELLNSKLQYNAEFFSDCEESEMYALISPLINLIKTIDNAEQPEEELIVQTALLSLKLLIKQLNAENPEKIVQILEFITDLIKSRKTKDNVLASLVLCLAELCFILRAHAIPNLNKFMPALLKIFKQQKQEDTPTLLLISILIAIQKILATLPLFLSPYLEKLLVYLSITTSKFGSNINDQKVAPVINKLNSVKEKIGNVIPARVLIPAVKQSYNTLIEKNKFSAVGALMDILGENLSNLKGHDVQTNLPELTNFFLNALQFRSENRTNFDEINAVETHIIKAFTTLILKLSESTFRPLYYKLYDWAVRSENKNERVITFYSLSCGIAKSLKGLFVLFAGHFLNNAASLLDACNNIKNEKLYYDDEQKNIMLLENVLKTLHCVFLYDNQNFVNKERFEVLMQPLVDQLENTLGSPENFDNRARNLLIPCIVQFAVATGNDALWKPLNYQVLLKLRHVEPQIRLIALECFTETTKKLGEDFLPLLPETIPFLAELLEDEDENVEKTCQKSIQELEKVLGEPLQKYF